MAREAPIAQREPGRQLLKVAVGRRDLAVAVMAVTCLPAGERDVVEEKPRGVARSAAAPGTAGRTGRDRGQAEGAARRLTHMPN